MSGAELAHRAHVSQLFRTHYVWLHARLCRYLDSSSYAEDIAADTFAQLLSTPKEITIREPRALLTTIARRLIYQLWRRRDVERAYLMTLRQEQALYAPSPEAMAQVHQDLHMIDVQLDGLPDKVKATFVLSRVHGLTYPQIAQQLGISQRSVSDYMARACSRCLMLDTVRPTTRASTTRESA